jgi:tetratricopeptide (TPR) repeat protein
MLALLLMLGFVSCAAPAAGPSDAANTPSASMQASPEADPVEAAATLDELEILMKEYATAEDYQAALRCADKMLEIDPNCEMAYYAQASFRLELLRKDVDALNAILAKAMETVPDPAQYAENVQHQIDGVDLSVTLPFVHDYASEDEINTYGVSSANYYNGGGVYGEWQNGLLTSQGEWVYYSVPAEGYAIYKMRAGGEAKQRLGEDCGCCLNAVGDWIYYCNNSENNCIFKMRTDGSERTQVSDDNCKYMAVCGEWIVYASMNEGDSLYKMKLDGSERTLVVQSPVMFPYLYGDRIYFRQRDERSFYSVALDGSDLKQLAPYIEGYCFGDDWIFYITDDSGMIVKKMRLDGSDVADVYRFAGKGGYALYTDGSLVVNDNMEDSDHEQAIAVDLDTMEKTVLVDEWCELFYIADGIGYYLDYEEGNAWYYVDLASGKTGKLE